MKNETFKVIENYHALTLISKLDGKYYKVRTQQEINDFLDKFCFLKMYLRKTKEVYCQYFKYDHRFSYLNGDGYLLVKEKDTQYIVYVFVPDTLHFK